MRDVVKTKPGELTRILTEGYAPYEQDNPDWADQGAWTDIYALGATLYVAVMGDKPISAAKRGAAFMNNKNDPYISVLNAPDKHYSQHFLMAIDNALKFEPKDRPQSLDVWNQMLRKGSVEPTRLRPGKGRREAPEKTGDRIVEPESSNLEPKHRLDRRLVWVTAFAFAVVLISQEVVKRTEKYADAEQALESEIARNNEEINKLRQFNAQVMKNFDDYKKQMNAIQGTNLSEQEKTENLKETKKIVTEQQIKAADALKSVEADLEETKNLFDTYQAQATPLDREKLEAEIADYEEEIRILSESVRYITALEMH